MNSYTVTVLLKTGLIKNLFTGNIYDIVNESEVLEWLIQLLPQKDVRDFSIDGADVGPP